MYIVVEGIDGSGKSTQAAMLAAELRAVGIEVVEVRQPSDSPIGLTARRIAATEDVSHPELDYLFVADRLRLERTVVSPALRRGAWVVCDRGVWSNVVYQGTTYGRAERVRRLNEEANILQPDLTVLLRLSAYQAHRRIEDRGTDPTPLEDLEEYERRYDELCARATTPFVEVSARGSVEETHEDVVAAVQRFVGVGVGK
jgi:dTMP kinase